MKLGRHNSVILKEYKVEVGSLWKRDSWHGDEFYLVLTKHASQAWCFCLKDGKKKYIHAAWFAMDSFKRIC